VRRIETRLAVQPAAGKPPLGHKTKQLWMPLRTIRRAVREGGLGAQTAWDLYAFALPRALFGKSRARRAMRRVCRMPLDSVRHFEVPFVRETMRAVAPQRVADVSSPRSVVLLALLDHPSARVEALNPDASDLEQTAALLEAAGVADRAGLRAETAEGHGLEVGTFDVVTCVSVLEHIVDDRLALEAMWSLLRPGGRLSITVPCAREPFEEYFDRDEYGVQSVDGDGWYFGWRCFSEDDLRSRVFAHVGEPARMELCGEIEAGGFFEQRGRLLSGQGYPTWRETLEFGRRYRRFERIDELPGLGVVGLEFVKP